MQTNETKPCCGSCKPKTEREIKLEEALKKILKSRQVSHAKIIAKEALQ